MIHNICSLQPHAETRANQIAAWRSLVLDYLRFNKQFIIDIREAQHQTLFSNTAINRKLDTECLLAILSDLQRTQNAIPLDKQRNRWEIYWHTLEEWAAIIYNYINSKGATNSVLTLFELTQGDEVQEEGIVDRKPHFMFFNHSIFLVEFCGLDADVLIKVLRVLEAEGKCELMLFDDQQGVKFF